MAALTRDYERTFCERTDRPIEGPGFRRSAAATLIAQAIESAREYALDLVRWLALERANVVAGTDAALSTTLIDGQAPGIALIDGRTVGAESVRLRGSAIAGEHVQPGTRVARYRWR